LKTLKVIGSIEFTIDPGLITLIAGFSVKIGTN